MLWIRSSLASWMASLWSARLIAEMAFSMAKEGSLVPVGPVRTSSGLLGSVVGSGDDFFLGALAVLLF